MSFDSYKNTNMETRDRHGSQTQSLNISPKNTTENVNIQEGLSAVPSQEGEFIKLGVEQIHDPDNIMSVEYHTSAGPIDNDLEDEPDTSMIKLVDEVNMRRREAKKRTFDPGEYTRIRNQMMGISRHSNSSRAGAVYNQMQFETNPISRSKHDKDNAKDTKLRVEQFDNMDQADLDLQTKLDSVKFYPKTNQAEARHQANR